MAPSGNDTTGDMEWTTREWRLVWIACAVAVALRFAFGGRGFWLDEYWTLHAAMLPTDALIRERVSAGHSPLTFFLAKAFLPLDFLGERGLRLGSALASGAAVAGMAALATRLGLKRLLPIVLALSVACPHWQQIGTEFRYTMPLVATAAWLWWAAVGYAREGTWRRACTLMGLATLCSYIHGSGFFVVASVMVFLIAAPRAGFGGGWRRAVGGVGAVSVALACVVPLMLALRPRLAESPARKGFVPFDMLHNLAESFFSTTLAPQAIMGLGPDFFRVVEIALIVAGVALALSARRDPGGAALPKWWIFLAVAGFFAAQAIYSATVSNVQGTLRFSAALSVPCIVLLAIAWDAAVVRGGRLAAAWRWALGGVVAVLLAAECANPGPWHRESIRWLADHRAPDQPVVTYGRTVNLLAFSFHEFPPGGAIAGIETITETREQAFAILRETWAPGDSAFLFQYRSSDDFVEESLDRLTAEGFVTYRREWRATSELRIIGVARNDAGKARLEALPELRVSPLLPSARR